jgi:hypothetical protein
MCYGYYKEKDAAGKEGSVEQVKFTQLTEPAKPEAGIAAARQAEEKAVARFLARVRQMVTREAQKPEELAR